ncbi:cyclitol dehydrogenase [Actinoplanes sp. SE50]|uniref:alcohol dehydrogenase catalytic domain-containing protein n=1 Tax=unclassified Actinoplanes TaxID=2626549 RepID=UPI00006CA2E1|nr:MULTISPECIES: alcohol dehydrogenase catalytic domain-containing protein [unclassified Actinoplanes]AEV84572.1 cyclitol dehydrogenase [Actinoplanes sp. SE50/110]ATO82964.1 cyclitol dehydrogenase [Actinoplanes sp. SE50]CAD29483.2 cyclitol dehydrogenase AcbL [Actinoplanes sp. SE50/110]SLM00372.1 cyclitol dehydrogenase [Actinoplanes sp. SE50/110]
MSRHRAIVRTGTGVVVADVPTPVPGPGELLVGTEWAGLCGTDIQMLRGLRDDPEPIIGHEGIARVIAAGDGVPGTLRPGTLVAVNPTHRDDPSFLLGHNVPGLLQERTLLPATAVSGGLVLPLPDGTDVTLGPLLEPLAVVSYALSQLGAVRPATLVIVGDGTVGHLAARAAVTWLAERPRVVLVHHTAAGRDFSAAGPHPADVLLTTGELAGRPLPGPVAALLATPRDATVEALEAVLAAAGADVLIDVLGGLPPGARSAMLPGVDLTAVRAANCGGFPEPALVTTTSGGTRLFGHRGVGNAHLRAAAGELARDPDRYRDLVTHRSDLAGAARIMTALRSGRDRIIDGRRLVKLAIQVNVREDHR